MPFENVKREAPHLLARRSVGGAAGRRSERARRGRDHAGGAAQAFERLQVPPAAVAHRCDGDPHRPARRRGAGRRRIAAARGRRARRPRAEHRARHRARAGRRDRARAAARAVRDLRADRAAHRAAVARQRRTRSTRQHPPVAAFENYIKGLLAETPATAINYSERGAGSGSRRSIARGWRCGTCTPSRAITQRALAAVAAGPGGFALGAARALSRRRCRSCNLKKYDEAFATFKALADGAADADRAQQPRRRPAAPRRQRRRPACRRTTSTRRPRPIRTIPTTSSIWATPTG